MFPGNSREQERDYACSLLATTFSDAGSTPAASTTLNLFRISYAVSPSFGLTKNKLLVIPTSSDIYLEFILAAFTRAHSAVLSPLGCDVRERDWLFGEDRVRDAAPSG